MSSRRRAFSSRAFTLVELLVVVGIVAVLISLLIPVVAGARRHALRVQCASNLRQIVLGFIQYGHDNRGYFPASGGWLNAAYPEDWIHWRRVDRLDDSAIAKYVGRPVNPALFRCPADDEWPFRKRTLALPGTFAAMQVYPYPYSYCSNSQLSCDEVLISKLHSDSKNTQFTRELWERFSLVREPCAVVLIGEVDERVMMSSAWDIGLHLPRGWVWIGLLSNRHDAPMRREEWKGWFIPANSYPDARGNVAFVDGHVDFAPRRIAHDPRVSCPNRPYHWDVPWAK